MYERIPDDVKQDQYKILLCRAHRRAGGQEAVDRERFKALFRNPDYAKKWLSPSDFEIYQACRDAALAADA